MDGVLRCSRYAFGPNRLHFCGPDANREIWDYLNEGFTDFGLQKLLKGFETLYPYLDRIARSNHITDPFDARVVEAYWIGNSLLDAVDKSTLHQYFIDDLRLKDKLPLKTFRTLEERIGKGILPNHNYHILSVPKKMGAGDMGTNIDAIDSCRISWGKVTAVSGPRITVLYEPLLVVHNKLSLGAPVEKHITRRLEAEYDFDMLQAGQYITLHWDIPCEVLTKDIVAKLRHHTQRAIQIANLD
jgi:Family of unknown function (DUF6390)